MANCERLPILFAFILCAGISYWLYLNQRQMKIDYDVWTQLIDPKSGQKKKPSEVLQLTKIFNYTSEYIEATNAEERLFDLRYNLDFTHAFTVDQHYSFPEEKLVAGWPVANQTLCGAQLDWILNQLVQHSNYTLLRGQLGFELTSLMDSFGRPGASTYAGLVSWLGSYEQCMRTSLDGGSIATRYCEARMKPKWWPRDDEAPAIPPTRIRLGVCLPETCDTLSLEHHQSAIERLSKFQLPEFYKNGLDLLDLFCLPDERSPIRQLPLVGRIFLGVMGCWLALVVAGTIIYEYGTARQRRKPAIVGSSIDDLRHHNQTKTAATSAEMSEPFVECTHVAPSSASLRCEQLAEAVSLRCSLKAFNSNPPRPSYHLGQRVRLDLSCLDFFKTVMLLMFIYIHTIFMASTYARNSTKRIDMNLDYKVVWALSLSPLVDTFFVFSGLLTTYNLMRKLTINQLASPLVWLGVNVERFLRMAPLFSLAYVYSRTVSPYTGAGPFWDYGVHNCGLKGACMHESWLRAIPYFGQLGVPYAAVCNLPSWYVTSYLQLLLVMPMLTYTLCKLPSHSARFALIGFLMLPSALNIVAGLYKETTITGDGFTLYGSFLFHLMVRYEWNGHMTTLGRARSVAVGCLVGYLLRQYELGKISKWPKWLRNKSSTVWLTLAAHVVIIILPLFNRLNYLQTQRLPSINEIAIGQMVTLIVWPSINAVLILLLVTNYCHLAVVRFFGHSFWRSFNRLGLCLYMLHWDIIWVLFGSYEQAAPYGYFSEILRVGALGAVLSIMVAFCAHLLVEAPLSRLITIMMRSSSPGCHPKGKERISTQRNHCDVDDNAATNKNNKATTTDAGQRLELDKDDG